MDLTLIFGVASFFGVAVFAARKTWSDGGDLGEIAIDGIKFGAIGAILTALVTGFIIEQLMDFGLFPEHNM